MANEKRLVDVNPLIERLSDGSARKSSAKSLYDSEFVQMLRNAPTVDAVEVIRCGKCIHRVKGTYAKCIGRRPDEFCSDGERRFHGEGSG